MKTIIKALLAASMLMPIAVQAQEQEGRERGPGRRGGDWGERAPRPERAAPAREANLGIEAQIRTERPQRGDFRTDRGPFGPGARQDGPGRPGFDPRGAERRGPDRRGPDWRNDRRGDDDWRTDRPQPDAGGQRPDRPNGGNDWRRDDRAPGRPDWRQPGSPQVREWRGNDRRDWNRERGGWADNRGNSWNRGGTWNRGWRNDGRYDWNRNRQLNRGAYRLPRYYAPSGWDYGYRRFSVGVSLSSGLFGRNYWIDDPYAYRLPEAYGPYRWVRYYDDALLVDIRTGQVFDAIYGIFY